MTNINLTPIIQAILALLAALVTYRLIPWIKSKTTESQQANIRALVKVLVFAAEQLYGAGEGKKKLAYVRQKLLEAGYDVDINEIEAAVAEYFNINTSLTVEEKGITDVELPALKDWTLDAIRDFFNENGIPCEGCETKDDYIRVITQGGRLEPPSE